jgi:hypothetical protein
MIPSVLTTTATPGGLKSGSTWPSCAAHFGDVFRGVAEGSGGGYKSVAVQEVQGPKCAYCESISLYVMAADNSFIVPLKPIGVVCCNPHDLVLYRNLGGVHHPAGAVTWQPVAFVLDYGDKCAYCEASCKYRAYPNPAFVFPP